jgi:UDP-3-O-[3-hydroxymyristoyl] glucosamine N-acyltransferase
MMLRDIAAALSASYVGDGEIEIVGIADPAHANEPGGPRTSRLALAMTREAVAALSTCSARAAVVTAECDMPLDRFDAVIKVELPRAALAVLTKLFDRPPQIAPAIHPSAVIAPDAEIAEGAGVGPLAVIGARARIGRGTMIHAHVTIGADATIGRDCLIHAGARIGDRVRIGDRAILHHNVSIGADGFSFVAPEQASAQGAGLMRIHSIGTVVLEDDVEVGANSAIDRATLAATRIGRNTKIDNLVQIGHNVEIGESCLICGMVGISGSVRIGDRVVLGGAVGIADHVTIGSDAKIAARSAVASDVPPGAVMAGVPAVPRGRAFEQIRLVGRLRSLYTAVAELKTRVRGLEQGLEQGLRPAGESRADEPPEG